MVYPKGHITLAMTTTQAASPAMLRQRIKVEVHVREVI